MVIIYDHISCVVLCVVSSCQGTPFCHFVFSFLVAFYVSFYARSEPSTRSMCARFGTSVKRDLKADKIRQNRISPSWHVLFCQTLQGYRRIKLKK